MEPIPAELSTSFVLIRPQSRTGSAAALFVLLLQLLFVGLVPVADARAAAADTGSALGVHVEKPGTHHAVHNPADCVFCTALQLGATPAQQASAPEAGRQQRLAAPPVPTLIPPTLPSALPVARAPPAA